MGNGRIDELISKYSELVEELKITFPHVDLKILLELFSHRLLHPEHKPTVRLEIFYDKNVNLNNKSSMLSKVTGVMPNIYRDEHRLVIEPRLELDELKEITMDNDIVSLAGDLICCLDTLLSRRKLPV